MIQTFNHPILKFFPSSLEGKNLSSKTKKVKKLKTKQFLQDGTQYRW